MAIIINKISTQTTSNSLTFTVIELDDFEVQVLNKIIEKFTRLVPETSIAAIVTFITDDRF